MVCDLTVADLIVFGVYLLATLLVGVWAARGQRRGDDFVAAGRPVAWGALSLGLAVAGPVALYYATAPAEVHTAGLRFLLAPALVWVAVPVAFWCLVPLYHNLEPDSVYEYLELRFGLSVRTAAAALYLAWQWLWLAAMLSLPCKVLHLGGGLSPQVLLVVVGTGAVVTFYTCRGAFDAATSVDLLKWPVMVAGMFILVTAVRQSFGDDVGQIWEVTRSLGRATIVDTSWDWSANWSVWAAAPALALLPLFFVTADPATVGRLLSARDFRSMNLSLVVGAILAGMLVLLAVYAGMGLMAVYHVHRQEEMRPNWVVHSAIDAKTGRPMIDERTEIDAESIGKLVDKGAILDPNTDRVVDDPGRLVDATGRVLIDRLATWDSRPRPDRPRKRIWEPRMRRGRDERVGWFVARHIRAPLAGLVLAGLIAAAMAALDSGLAAMAGVALVDFHRRRGWAESWLARRLGKSPDDLDETDELRLARPLVVLLGTLVVLASLAMVHVANLFSFMVLLVSVVAAPMVAVFILGLFTRRTTAPAALVAMAVGLAVSLWMALGHYLGGVASLGWAWPGTGPMGIFWPLPLGFLAALGCGFLLGPFVGRRKNRVELTGLVLGLGAWGAIVETADDEDAETGGEEIYWIDGEEEEKGPWR